MNLAQLFRNSGCRRETRRERGARLAREEETYNNMEVMAALDEMDAEDGIIDDGAM
jgi:hypothetical protein